MKKILFLFFFPGSVISFAQKTPPASKPGDSKRGTITVHNDEKMGMVVFDSVNYRLTAITENGKTPDSAVISFDMSILKEGSVLMFSANGSFLSAEMKKQYLSNAYKNKIYFDNIKAKEKSGAIRIMP